MNDKSRLGDTQVGYEVQWNASVRARTSGFRGNRGLP